jgi:hypothetical protein
VAQAGQLSAILKVVRDTANASGIPAWRPVLQAIFVLLLAAACSSTPPPPRKTYDVSIDFLKLAQGQCMAVSSFTNRYDEPLRISGDIRLLGRDGKLIGNVPLITETLPPAWPGRQADRQRTADHRDPRAGRESEPRSFPDADSLRCRHGALSLDPELPGQGFVMPHERRALPWRGELHRGAQGLGDLVTAG